MKIALIDSGDLVYTVETPLHSPLGGSESAASFLALAWIGQGHEVWLFNAQATPSHLLGVEGRPRAILTPEWVETAAFDVLIELSIPHCLPTLVPQLKRRPLCLLWAHIHPQEERTKAQNWRALEAIYKRFIFVSQHQERSYILRFQLDPDQCLVMVNGINPRLENIYAAPSDLARAKQPHPQEVRLLYASSPNKGVDLLPAVFPSFRRLYPQATLEVYSSSQDLYQTDWADQAHATPLQQLDTLPGVLRQGALDPVRYGERLQAAQVLLYPCYNYTDTCAIILLEAMAAGCLVIPTDVGALPETSAAFGLIAPYQDRKSFPDAFFLQMVRAAKIVHSHPERYLERIWTQRNYILKRHTWRLAAQRWLALFAELGA